MLQKYSFSVSFIKCFQSYREEGFHGPVRSSPESALELSRSSKPEANVTIAVSCNLAIGATSKCCY